MARLLKLLVLMVVTSSAATSHPFGHRDASRHTDFEWNSRKIGSRRVATVRIRKDEERDRRSILVGDDDDDDSFPKTHRDPAGDGRGRRRHAHRHHHGDETPDAVWVSAGDAEGGGRSSSRRHREKSSRRIDASSLNDRSLNDIQPEDLPLLLEALDDAGVEPSHYLAHNATTTVKLQGRKQRGNRSGGGRRRTKSKNKKKKNKKKKKGNKKKGGRKKGSKACRKLKGRQKKNCREVFKKCRRLRGREKKQCRTEASQTIAAATAEDDMFSFITPSIEMNGSEACQYHYLTECCKQVGLLSQATDSLRPVDKCYFREEFLKCMEAQREGTCEPSFHTRGNMTALRNKIKEVIWTNNSCLISEVEEG